MVELIAKRYANALFDIAVEQGLVEQMLEEAEMLLEILETQPEIIHILQHPQVGESQRIEMIETAFGEKLLDPLVGLMVLTVRKNRQDCLPEILNSFKMQIYAYLNIEFAHITAHKALTETQKEKVLNKLKTITQGKEIRLIENTDTSLIGGMIIKIGDRVMDYSVKGLMMDMKKQLLKNA